MKVGDCKYGWILFRKGAGFIGRRIHRLVPDIDYFGRFGIDRPNSFVDEVME